MSDVFAKNTLRHLVLVEKPKLERNNTSPSHVATLALHQGFLLAGGSYDRTSRQARSDRSSIVNVLSSSGVESVIFADE